MAGVASLAIKLDVTGIGDDVIVQDTITLTTPIKRLQGYTVLSTATTTAFQLFSDTTKIALAKIYGVYIKAEAGTIYLLLNTTGTTTFTTTTADLALNVGEVTYLPINPASNLGLKIDGDTTSAAFSYVILGKA